MTEPEPEQPISDQGKTYDAPPLDALPPLLPVPPQLPPPLPQPQPHFPPPVWRPPARPQPDPINKTFVAIGRFCMFGAGGFQCLIGMVLCMLGLLKGFTSRYSAIFDDLDNVLALGVVNVLLGLVYFGLGVWAKKAPFPASSIALCLCVSSVALNGVLSPETIIQSAAFDGTLAIAFFLSMKSGYVLKRHEELYGPS